MMDGDLDSTNPSVESEPVRDGSTSETRLDSASVYSVDASGSSAAAEPVETVNRSVADGSMDSVSVSVSVSAGGNVSDVDNRNNEVSSDRGVKRVKSEKKKKVMHKKKESKSKELKSTVYDSMISEFDEFAANGSVANEDRSLMEASPGHGFEVGDMVWGKVKSHPWWPGHIFSEKFATTSVRRSKRDGLLLVAFFGDSSYGWFHPSELIPFDANYAEKSKQTNSRTFVKAVEEAMDEVSRRSALGLSCMCRSKQNFRQTDVQGYYAVDVADYEPGAVYSIDAIGKARESFQPSPAIDFIRRLALEPMGGVNGGVDFVKNKAKVISYRRAVYEEFDETYAQAFGYDSGRPSSGSSQEQDHRKTPSKAPLSGRQVFADTSGKGKNSAKPNKPKDQSKKDKYLFKRRDDPKEVKPHPKKNKNKVTSPSQLEHIKDDVAVPAGDYVLQKRPSTTTHDESVSKDSDANMEDTPVTVKFKDPGFQTISNDDKTIDSQMEDKTTSSDPVVDRSATDKRAENAEKGPKKVKKIAKRPFEAGSSEKKKKKIKKEQLISDGSGTNKVPLVGPGPHGPDDNKSITSHASNNEPELPRMLGDLHLLALDPFRDMNRGRLIKTRQAFLKFRSRVFRKSLNSSQTPDDDDDDADDSNGNDNRSNKPSENATGVTPVKSQPVSSVRPDDPTLGGRKRGPSDRQEEMAARKKKKVGEIRTLTKDKKVIKKIDEPTVKQPVVKTLKKQGPELFNRTEQRAPLEPTMLAIKFPQDGSLPSMNELKARFARFGPMDHSATRIHYKTFGCRVVYRHKAHALAAYKFVLASNNLFGNTDIKCTLKEVGADLEPAKAVKAERQLAPSNVQLKSILKKSGGEEAAGSGGRGRVKFMLSGEENEMKNKNGASSFSSKSHSTMDVNSKNFQKAVLQSSNPLPPLLPLPTSTSIISPTTQFTRPPPPQQPPMHYAPPPQPQQPPMHYAPPPRLPPPPSLSYGGGEMATKTLPPPPPVVAPKADISHQMLSLLTKCNEVVTNVTNMFGYVPYRPL